MRISKSVCVAVIVSAISVDAASCMDLVRQETEADLARALFGVSGKNVVVAILDRGIDWDHPDFVKCNNTTRIKWMLDMSGFNLCDGGNPPPVEYTEAQINAALAGGPTLAMRDAVGHGTLTAGVAAGNGRAAGGGKYQGMAPGADLLVVKLTSEGAPAHGSESAETAFQGCIDDALDWVAEKLDLLGKPGVAIINSGTQWGPIDGSSAVSAKFDEVFGPANPGRIMVIPSGDEGAADNHAAVDFNNSSAGVINFNKNSTATSFLSAWYTGSRPAEVTLSFSDGTVVGPVASGGFIDSSGVVIVQYTPGNEFYPWLSTSGDRAIWMRIDGHAGMGSFTIQGEQAGVGHIDLFGDLLGPNLTPVVSFTDNLVAGRLTDYAASPSAIVVADHVVRTDWTDVDGIPRSLTTEGLVGDLWTKSSGGPTRDGRTHGVDLSAPGQNLFAAIAQESYWSTLNFNHVQDGLGWYSRFGGTSGSAPITVGAVALILELDPTLNVNEVRQILQGAATADANTGATPNALWGFGKLNMLDALEGAATFNCGASSANLVLENETVSESRIEEACHSISTGPSFLVQAGVVLSLQAPEITLGNGTSIDGALTVTTVKP